jgi:predicted transcriptional regulator
MTLRASYSVRLSSAMRQAVESLARTEGISVNQVISIAIAEKLSRLEHQAWILKQSLIGSAKADAPRSITPTVKKAP